VKRADSNEDVEGWYAYATFERLPDFLAAGWIVDDDAPLPWPHRLYGCAIFWPGDMTSAPPWPRRDDHGRKEPP
jgi:hypothetical protein